jgi:hypothetical protein
VVDVGMPELQRRGGNTADSSGFAQDGCAHPQHARR